MNETTNKVYNAYAVLYCRYSCDRQNEQSIDGQIRVCSEFAERNNIKIVGTYIDKAMSGTNDNRDDFQRMLRDSDRKQWQYVIVVTYLYGHYRQGEQKAENKRMSLLNPYACFHLLSL